VWTAGLFSLGLRKKRMENNTYNSLRREGNSLSFFPERERDVQLGENNKRVAGDL